MICRVLTKLPSNSDSSAEITAYGFYLIGWVALWACSVGTVATAKEYREAYVKTPKTDISTSQKQMMETADFLWIGEPPVSPLDRASELSGLLNSAPCRQASSSLVSSSVA